MKVLRTQLALARSFGVECEEISPARAGELFPLMRTDDLAGAIWIPGDGKANPADLCMSLAKGARQRGVKIVEGRGGDRRRRRDPGARRTATGVRVRHDGEEQDIACEIVVNCAGQWARQFGALAGVNVPLWSAEHFYIVTDRIEGVHPMLPVMRDPDGYIYYKEEVGGLVMGGFEPKAKPWSVDPIPATFQLRAARRGLGPVRAADDRGDPSHAVPRDGAGQDAAQRARRASRPTATSSSARRPSCAATSSPPASTPPASPTRAAPGG